MKLRSCFSTLLCALCVVSSAAYGQSTYALAAFGEDPKYPATFTHFDYVNPEAPKGGSIAISTEDPLRFDHLIPYSMDGVGVSQIDSWVYAPLAYSSMDEPDTVYGFVASTIEMAPDRSWMRFTLNPKARFDDGTPITASDVAFTFDLMAHHAGFTYRAAFAGVKNVVVESPTQVKFIFDGAPGRSLPMSIAKMRVLPEHWWKTRDFEHGGGYEPPLGSGPYRVAKVVPGETVVFERVKNWWGENLPAAKGQFNFDRITLKVYGSRDVMRQALLAHDIDINFEKSPSTISVGYNVPAAIDGRLQKVALPATALYASGYVFNSRRPQLSDRRVREAIAMLWDYEWVNSHLYYSRGRRQTSMFAPVDLQAKGVPGKEEVAALEPLRQYVAPEVFTQEFALPVSDGSGDIRKRQIAALHLLESAGWRPSGDKLVNAQGQPLALTFLNVNKGFERSLMQLKRSLAQIGVTFNIQTVDVSQYGRALQGKQYDMIYNSYVSPLTPGRELIDYYSSQSYDRAGSSNWMGEHNIAADTLIKGILAAHTRDEMQTLMHALDRVMQWQYLWIPANRQSGDTYVYWNRFGMPDVQAKYGAALATWWVKSDVPQPQSSRLSVAGREAVQ